MSGDRFAVKDETGNRHGNWQVIERGANAGGNVMWLCRCLLCKATRTIAGIKLRSSPPRCACQLEKP